VQGPACTQVLKIGDFVKVEADRGEDLGIITEIMNSQEFIERGFRGGQSLPNIDEDYKVRKIIRPASLFERQRLPEKYHDEQCVLRVSDY